MAGATVSSAKTSVLCKFFMNGVCREGSSCRFSHDRENSSPDMVCRFYLQGCCSYGSRCRYDHVKPSQTSQPASFQSPTNTVTTAATTTGAQQQQQQQQECVFEQVNHLNSFSKGSDNKLPDLWDAELQDNLDNFYKNSSLWSSAPSTSDKVILRGGRIKTKADWAKESQEFVPRQPVYIPAPSYAQVTTDTTGVSPQPTVADQPDGNVSEHSDECYPEFNYPDPVYQENLLCPYLMHGACPNMDECCYLHGEVCEMCGTNVLHPTDMDQRREHEAECIQQLEENMEYSFLMALSKEKECSICMENVVDKTTPQNRFGLLPNCNHIFCLSCIRKWRSSTLEKDVIRSCPECRIASNFVTPSNVWVEDKTQKDKIIDDYKEKMRKKPCKYFDQGRKKCPFSDSCFYLHAYPDGTIALPEKIVGRRHRSDANGHVSSMPQFSLWEFIYERNSQRENSSASVLDTDQYSSFTPSSSDSDSEELS